MKRVRRFSASVVGAAFLLAGCNSKTSATPENYTNTMNAYFGEHSDCLFDGSVRFPFETSDPTLTRQMDSLATAQMLEGKKEPMIHTARYTLTDTGTRMGKNFCFGHRQVTSIDSSTAPAKANGFVETEVQYHYKLTDVPVWAKTPEVVAAFPKLAEEASGTATGKITLALTGVGWSVPD